VEARCQDKRRVVEEFDRFSICVVLVRKDPDAQRSPGIGTFGARVGRELKISLALAAFWL
jgi:hypothetical protein